jgi:ribonucleotide monophosphatase NagD (HAD superfamily)
VLLTNGGGKTEAARVELLTEKLKVNLTVENFVQSHTPFKEMVNGTLNNIGPLENKTVLVTGLLPEKIRDLAES